VTFTVYGIRLTDQHEVRYVGMTRKPIHQRLVEHSKMPCVPHLSGWLRAHWDLVEVFPIAVAHSESEAREIEKATIQACARLSFRLFNRAHVPHPLRFNAALIPARARSFVGDDGLCSVRRAAASRLPANADPGLS
jgi:hypothetical protein